MGQRYKLPDGTIVEAQPDGSYAEVTGAPAVSEIQTKAPDPEAAVKRQILQLDLQSKMTQAAKGRIDLQNAQEAYDAAHPKTASAGTVFGPDYLKTLPGPDQELVKALAEGRLAFPGGFALKAPWWQQKLEQVAQYDPSFDATNYNNRAKARAMLLTGKVGTSANALNTSIGHLGLLNSQIGGTASHSFTPANAVINSFEQMTGDPGITNFKDTAGKLASELTSVYRNGGGAEADVVRQLQSLDPNASQAQKQAVIRNALDLLASKQAANLYQYSLGGGKPSVDLLDPAAHKVLDQFPDIRDKYFGGPDSAISPAAAALLKANGGTPPPSPPPAPPPTVNDAPIIGGGTPHADYSSLVGGPGSAVATMDPNSKLGVFKQTYRNEFDPVMASTMSSFIKKGIPYETAATYAQSHGFVPPKPDEYAAAVSFAKAHNGATNVSSNRMVPTTLGERLSSSPAAAAFAGGVTGATAGLSDVAGRSLAGPEWDANRAALAATNPTADLLGNVAGGVAGMYGGGSAIGNLLRVGAKSGAARNALALALKNPVVTGALGDAGYGGVYGASENPDNPVAGATTGALLGGATGLGGNLLTKGAGAVLQGVTDPAVQRLRALGIPLTVGEVLGGGAKKAQDALTSVFGPGNMVARRYAEGRQALNKAAFNQAGSVIDTPIDQVGQAGINALDAAKNAAYDKALAPVNLDLTTPQFQGMRSTLDSAASAIPDVKDAQSLAASGLKTYLDDPATDGVMNGRAFQEGYRGLSRLGNQPDTQPFGYEIGNVMKGGKLALAATLQDQAPGAYENFLKANAANRMLSILAKAQNAAKNQIGDDGNALFTPAQLGNASTQNAIKYGSPIAAAGGNRPFNQLINDSQQVMSSKLPTSGTAERVLATTIATGGLGGLGGGAGYGVDGGQGAAEGAAIPLGLLTALGTRRGQQLLTAALIKRTVADQVAGRALSRTPQIGGNILTAAGIPLAVGP